MERLDAIVIGGGAAGLSASLTLGRSCRSVAVFDDGRPRNRVAQRMHGFLTRDGTPPQDVLAIAREQLQRYASVRLHDAHVEQALFEHDGFTVKTADGETFAARAVLLATGVYDALPPIDGIADLWGRLVHVCPYCDGWEVRDRRVAVLGKGRRAVELAQELKQWSDDLLVCVEGERELPDAHQRWLERVHARVRRAALTSVREAGGAVELRFEDGAVEEADALFLCAPLRQRHPLVDMLGCTIDADGNIAIDSRGRTVAPGVYAAGDCVTDVHQVVLAAASGVCAAMALNEDLLAADVRALTS